MLGALTRFVEGSVTRARPSRGADLPLRKLAAVEALARHGRATPALVGAIAIEPMLLTNGGLLDWISVLERVPGSRSATRAAARPSTLLRARLDVQGTTLGFATSRGGVLDWLLATTDVERGEAGALAPRRAGVARRRAAPRARRALAPARGRLADHDGERLGRARAREVLARLRGGRRSPATTQVELARRRAATSPGPESPQGAASQLAWPDARARARAATRRHRRAVGARAEPRGAAARASRSRAATASRRPRSPSSQRTPGGWSRGDVARVRVARRRRRAGELGGGRATRFRPARRSSAAGSAATGAARRRRARRAATRGRPSPSAVSRSFRRYYEFVPKGELHERSTPCASTRPGASSCRRRVSRRCTRPSAWASGRTQRSRCAVSAAVARVALGGAAGARRGVAGATRPPPLARLRDRCARASPRSEARAARSPRRRAARAPRRPRRAPARVDAARRRSRPCWSRR